MTRGGGLNPEPGTEGAPKNLRSAITLSQLLWIPAPVPLHSLRGVSQMVNARPWCCGVRGCQSWELVWGGRASSGRVLPGEACVPLATVAHVRGRAGVGQAEGLEQQERRMAPEWASGEMLV